MQVFLTALGCRLNEAELQLWSNDFNRLGISVTGEVEDASLIVVNTCAVTSEAARKSRQTIRKLHRKNPQARVVVTGCYASLEKQQAEALLGVDLIVSNADKNLLAEKSKELIEWKSMPYAATEPEESALFVRNRERAFIKIQDGCRYRCTYCIVTVARGDESSRTVDELLAEIRQLQQQGVKEIVLTGVHVGGYGSDIETSLYKLVVAILEKTSVPRIRFASVEPWDLPDNFFELFKNKRLMPHMHLPIQSGSNRILKKMSRRCKSETFLNLLQQARNVNPDFNITTDIIVGFPGETEEDFELSREIIRQAGFGHVHIFSYSNREGTKAARLPDQIETVVKKQRSTELHQLASEYKRQCIERMINQQQTVLWEGKAKRLNNGKYRFYGYTENYLKVFVDIDEPVELSNRILRCRIDLIDDESGLLKVSLLEPLSTTGVDQLIITQI